MKIDMRNISKSFGTNKVLEKIDLELQSGQIHALMGENGAGKSTLMNILTGLFPASTGTIYIDGEERTFSNPQEAEEFGISFIHQEMNTWPEMTVLENLFLGREIKTTFGLLNQKLMRQKALETFKRLGVTIPLDIPIGNLSVGQQQMIEIAKSLLNQLSILVMDEPTAALTDRETENLFRVIRGLKQEGVGVVYISHRMEEIFKITDFVTVMRDGVIVDTKKHHSQILTNWLKKWLAENWKITILKNILKLGLLLLKLVTSVEIISRTFPFMSVKARFLDFLD